MVLFQSEKQSTPSYNREATELLEDATTMNRHYFSARNKIIKLGLDDLRNRFLASFEATRDQDAFQQRLGYCARGRYLNGYTESSVSNFIFRRVGIRKAWPVERNAMTYSENDLFDMVEFLHDHAQVFHNHSWSSDLGQKTWRAEVNQFLPLYGSGFQLGSDGQIHSQIASGLADLMVTPGVGPDAGLINDRLNAAITSFTKRGATDDDKRHAVRDLADACEKIRPMIESKLTNKDEKDLFEIANRFGIRHHRADQQGNYEAGIFLEWLFYYYLATLHASLKLNARSQVATPAKSASDQ